MPAGIILKSASHEESDEVREKNLEAVVEAAGYEVEKEPEAPLAEPKRADFKDDEEFEAAHVAWKDKEQEREEAAEENDEEETQQPARKSRRTRAIERATAPLLARIKELEEKSGKEPEQRQEPEKKKAQRPKRADFTNNEEYEDALLAWGTEKAIADKALKDAQSADQARFEQNIKSYFAQVEEAREAHEDWDDLKAEFDEKDIFIGQSTQLAILEQENGAEVIYYLMRHPAYATKLGEMTPLSAVMEVGRLSAKLKGGTGASRHKDEAGGGEQRKPRPPKLPAPVRPVSTGGSNSKLTFAELAAKPNYAGKAKDLRRLAAAEN